MHTLHTGEPEITQQQSDDLLAILLAPSIPEVKPAPRPIERKSRHFYRCQDCLSVVALDAKLPERKDKWGYSTQEPNAVCDACGADIEYMGATKYTVGGHEYALSHQTGILPACDGKCIGATGPNCDCICGGENHGTGRTVPVFEESGVPRVVIPAEARQKADEYRALVAEFKAAWDKKYGYLAEMKKRGEWIQNYSAYMDGVYQWRNYLKARTMRTHAGRNKKLRTLISESRS